MSTRRKSESATRSQGCTALISLIKIPATGWEFIAIGVGGGLNETPNGTERFKRASFYDIAILCAMIGISISAGRGPVISGCIFLSVDEP